MYFVVVNLDTCVWCTGLITREVNSSVCSSFPALLNYLPNFSMMVWVKFQQIWWKEKLNSPSQLEWTDELPFRFPKEGFPFDEVQILFAQCKMIRHPRPKVTAFLLMVLNIVVTQFRLWQMSQFLWLLRFFISIKFFSIIKQPFASKTKISNGEWVIM